MGSSPYSSLPAGISSVSLPIAGRSCRTSKILPSMIQMTPTPPGCRMMSRLYILSLIFTFF